MMKRLKGVLEKARQLESTIAAKVEGTAARVTGEPAERQPLELVHAVVDAVAREIQPAGRGQNGFPFNRIRVVLLAPNARAKAQLQAIVEGPQPLPQRIDDRLRAAGCVVKGLSIQVVFVTKPRADWTEPDFHIECARVSTDDDVDATADARLDLAILAGVANRASYTFGSTAVALGRGTEVCDSRGRLIRTNHVAFTEGASDVNQTVSRLHARIEHEPATGTYRIFDDGSAQGTSVTRQGRGYTVTRTRGMALVAGDEIVLGRARLKVKGVR